jgi:hypothetical protein
MIRKEIIMQPTAYKQQRVSVYEWPANGDVRFVGRFALHDAQCEADRRNLAVIVNNQRELPPAWFRSLRVERRFWRGHIRS